MNQRLAAAVLAGSLLLAACQQQVSSPPASAAAEPAPAPAPAVTPVVNVKPPEPPPEPPPKPSPWQRRQHRGIHGRYLTGWVTGIAERFNEIVDYMKKSGLNGVVIDAKDDDGHTSWVMDNVPLTKEIGANVAKVKDIKQRVQYLHDNDIYTICRIVVYADPTLGKARPELAILGGKFVDSRGIRWPDPYNKKVWEYNVQIAQNCVAQGFDEVQFDYIRFPEHRIQGYNAGVPVKQRTDAVEGFLRYAREQLEPKGVFVAADVFGLTTSVAAGDDMEIGQDYGNIAGIVDYILPMVYPSHYEANTYGVVDPNADPGRIVFESLKRGQERTLDLPVRKHRPWIQDFKLGKTYTRADIEAQILGLAKAGIYQWVLWDPSNKYTRNVNYNIAGFSGPEPEWKVDLKKQQEQQAQQPAEAAGPPPAGARPPGSSAAGG